MKAIVPTDSARSFDHDMSHHHATRFDNNLVANNAVWPDLDIVVEMRLLTHDGAWMNPWHDSSSVSLLIHKPQAWRSLLDFNFTHGAH
jgi:hypothetical protein